MRLAACMLHIAGMLFFIAWVLQTDIMFGHFTGPMWMLGTALALSSGGIALTICVAAASIRNRIYAPVHTPRRPVKILNVIVKGLGHAVSTLASGLVVLIAILEILGV